MKYLDVIDILVDENPDALLADGFEAALIGVAHSFNNTVALYDLNKCINILVKRDKMVEEDAIEYLNYNVLTAYVGQHAPIFAYLL